MTLPTGLRLKDKRWAIIRRAQPVDAEPWIRNYATVAAERIYIMTEHVSKTVDQVRVQFAEADLRKELYLAAEVEGALVGGADFRRGSESKNAHVAGLGIALLEAYRGIGLGRAMMEAGISWARSVGVSRLKLGVFATNGRAIALYRKLGFVEEGRLRGEVVLDGKPVDELLMALSL